MTVRNLFYGPTISELGGKYKIRIISYYSDQLTNLSLTTSENITFSTLTLTTNQTKEWCDYYLELRKERALDLTKK